MYYHLLSALKRRLINELQDSFAQHPLYNKLVPNIQNKYSFNERPQFGIVIKGGSANKVALSADNFLGTVESHVMLAYYGQPSYPIEWVREDQQAIAANEGVFPIQPGVYYIEILSVPTNASELGTYIIDPLLTVTAEPVIQFQSGIEREGQLQNKPVPKTLRLYQNRHYMLKEGEDYSVDYTTGAITFISSFSPQTVITADYRFAAPSFEAQFRWNTPDNKTLPGVILAFGKRARVGDKVAVMVYPERRDTARAYGGKFELTFDLDVIAQDPSQMEEIADLVLMYLWGIKKPYLEDEGIELVDVSLGGEAEEQKDETADIFFYTASLSIQLRADWEVHFPLPFAISRATFENAPTAAVASNLFFATAPLFAQRNNDFERIG